MADMTPAAHSELPPSLVQVATGRLRRSVLSGELRPGERIIEETLCAQLGISRAPLREALRLLAQQGLVEHLPRRGFRVTVWSSKDIRELFDLRRTLEIFAMQTALPLTPEPGCDPLAGVRSAFEDMRIANTAGNEVAKDDAHRAFHEQIVRLAGSTQLDLIYTPLLMKLQLPMARNIREEARLADPIDGLRRHEQLIHALETNDAEIAIKAIEAHGELTYLHLDATV